MKNNLIFLGGGRGPGGEGQDWQEKANPPEKCEIYIFNFFGIFKKNFF